MKIIPLFIVSIMCVFQICAQVQIGHIDGESDGTGMALAFSGDGKILAIGASLNGDVAIQAGKVRVFESDGGVWKQLGDDIYGEAEGDWFGGNVAISDNGSVVAIGAIFNDGNGSNSGSVSVYEYIGGVWKQIGKSIYGEAAEDALGTVSLNGDGSILAVGATLNDGNGTDAGHVRIYENDNGTWKQVGDDIDGETADDFSGTSVSLSDDGNIVAIGAMQNDDGADNGGHVRVYENDNGTWKQIGQDIDGDLKGCELAHSVSLSSDGNIVAMGAPWSNVTMRGSGHVRVYENDNGTWKQIGEDIEGDKTLNTFGLSVSLSADGSFVAIGADAGNGKESSAGNARVFRNDNGSWKQVGNRIDGERHGDVTGKSVSISNDGSIVAVGSPWAYDEVKNIRGQVRIYQLFTPITIPNAPIAKAASSLNPGKGFTAHWDTVSGAEGYSLDIATDSGFTNFLTGFENKDVGDVTTEVVSTTEDKVYYRVRAYNTAGQSDNSNVIAVIINPVSTDDLKPANIQVYPNPTFGALNLTFENDQPRQISILDIAGKEVFQRMATGINAMIDLSGLRPGSYLLQIQTQEKTQAIELVKK